MKALLKKAMKDRDHQATMAAAQVAAAALAAAAPKKHAAAALQAATAAAQVQVTKSALLLSGKFFRGLGFFRAYPAHLTLFHYCYHFNYELYPS